VFAQEDLYNHGFRNTIFNYVGRSISAIVSLFIAIYILNRLVVEEYGIYNLLFAALTLISMFVSFGIPSVIERYVPEYYQNKDYTILKKLIFYGLLCQTVAFTICVVLIWFCISPIALFLKAPPIIDYFSIFLFVIILAIQIRSLRYILNSLLLQGYENLMLFIYSILQGGLYYFALRQGYGLKGLIWAALLVNLITFVLYLLVIRAYVFLLPSQSKKGDSIQRVFKYGLLSYFNELSYMGYEIPIDIYIISNFLGPKAVGLYSFAALMSFRIINWTPAKVADSVITPIFIRRYTQNNDQAELCYMFQLLNKFIAFFLFPLTAGVVFLGSEMITYIVPKYRETLPIFIMFMIVYGINAIAFSVGLIWQILEKPQIGLYSRVFILYNLIMDIILVRYFGIAGVAFATGSSLVFKAVLQFILTKRYIDIKFPWGTFLKMAINSGIMVMVLLFARQYIVDVYSLILVILVGILSYFSVSYLHKTFERRDRDIFNKMIGIPIFRF